MNTNQLQEMSAENINQDKQVPTWWATEFMDSLGYSSIKSFNKPLQRAIQSCRSIDIATDNQFIEETRLVEGKSFTDYKLTRFACYMILVNTNKSQSATISQLLQGLLT